MRSNVHIFCTNILSTVCHTQVLNVISSRDETVFIKHFVTRNLAMCHTDLHLLPEMSTQKNLSSLFYGDKPSYIHVGRDGQDGLNPLPEIDLRDSTGGADQVPNARDRGARGVFEASVASVSCPHSTLSDKS